MNPLMHKIKKKYYQDILKLISFLINSKLGSMLCIVQVFLGYQAGQIIVSYSSHVQRVVRFVIWSLTTTVIGVILCGASKDEGWIPINKNLWLVKYFKVNDYYLE